MLRRFEPYALSVMRIVIGFTFLCHGLQKFLGWFGGLNGAAAAPYSKLWIAGVLELAGGTLIVLGLFVGPVAFILCGEMAVAYFTQHAPKGPWPIQNGGELAVLYCFIFLHFCTSGGGAWSLDRLIERSHAHRT
jgi:putative oxidoreductase